MLAVACVLVFSCLYLFCVDDSPVTFGTMVIIHGVKLRLFRKLGVKLRLFRKLGVKLRLFRKLGVKLR